LKYRPGAAASRLPLALPNGGRETGAFGIGRKYRTYLMIQHGRIHFIERRRRKRFALGVTTRSIPSRE
jgi:hypothetical protein